MKRWLLRIILILVGIIALLAAYLLIPGRIKPAQEIKWGVTFTKSHVEYLGLDWREVYLNILDDLKVAAVRVGLNWDEIEARQGEFYFADYDWMFNEAEKRGVEVLPVVGFKLPRWPECRAPQWASALPQKEFEEAQFKMIEAVVNHFKNYQNIKMWQMENEAFIEWFGDCPPMNDSLARRKVKFLRGLDPSRPILMTESGELTTWLKSGLAADVLGFSLYQRVYNKWYGYSDYWLPASFYARKAKLTQAIRPVITRLWKNHNQVMTNVLPVIVTELQLEAWTPAGTLVQPIEEQLRVMGPEQIKKTINFARQTGFDTFYGWGVEWWWWMKEKGHPEFWQTAKAEFGK